MKRCYLNLLPPAFHLFCLIGHIIFHGNISMYLMLIERIANIVIFPIYLVVINICYIKNGILNHLLVYMKLIFVIIFGEIIILFNWWFPQAMRVPVKVMLDSDTKLIVELSTELGLIILTLSWIIANIIRVWRRRFF